MCMLKDCSIAGSLLVMHHYELFSLTGSDLAVQDYMVVGSSTQGRGAISQDSLFIFPFFLNALNVHRDGACRVAAEV